MAHIHPTAIVDSKAQLASDVEIGPYSIIGPDVRIAAHTRVGPHCVINGHTTIGERNRIYQFCSIGEENQDKKYKGEPTTVEIGNDNTIHEYTSIHRGTVQDTGRTVVGNHNWIMAYVHIAHDCVVTDHTTLANNATLAGHVFIGEHTVLGGFVGVHQFCKVGAHVMAGVSAVVLQDVPPYLMVTGNPCEPRGVNSEGLKRRGFSADEIASIKRSFRVIYRDGLRLEEAKISLAEMLKAPDVSIRTVKPFLDFFEQSSRGIVR
jgi:UDP-N-acetylglucosamine acyltransferase